MLTESFVNSCFQVILNKKSKIKKSKSLYRDILEIISFTDEKEKLNIPMKLQNKADLLKEICKLLLEDKTIDNVIDSITFGDKYREYQEFLELKIAEELKDDELADVVRHIRIRKKINALFENYDELAELLDKIKSGTFDSIDDLVGDYEITVKKLYSNLMESNRAVTIEAAASLDLVKDDFAHVIEMIRRKYERVSTTPTGFKILDSYVMNGGYEPSRLYIYGGGSGAGKSTILNNSIYISATTPRNLMNKDAKPIEKGVIDQVYLYITLENTIEEALMRTYQPMFNKTLLQMLDDIRNKVDIKKSIMDELAKNGSTIIMKYFPAASISSIDLMGVLDEAIDQYGKDAIKGLYIDYLDLLKVDTRYDLYRLELGHIALSLKTLAVHYNIPVITATQLGRSAYRIEEAKQLNVDQISESIKKVEHADFVMLLAKDTVDEKKVHGKVGKNRSGKSNVAVDFTVDFEKFKFYGANLLSNQEKPDSTSCDIPLSFDGVGNVL